MYSRKRKATKAEILLRTAAVLFCLVALSTAFIPGLYARYITRHEGGDSARVIKFGELKLTETGNYTPVGDANRYIFIPGVPLEKKAEVAFGGSESATVVFVALETPGWTTADGRNFSFDGGQMTWSVASFWKHLKDDGNTHVYYKELKPNEELPATSVIANDQITVSADGTVEAYATYTSGSISINITAYAAQSNGFANLNAAWASVSGH